MEVDIDEDYVSGNLSSGRFSSLGEVASAPSSLTGPSSLGTAVREGEEREGMRDVGRGGGHTERKKLSQLPSRRKKAYPSRHNNGGEGREGSPGVSGTRNPPLPTPTTQLTRQINTFQLTSPAVTGAKRTLADREDELSPMSDSEGGGLSLSDAGYVSLPPGHPSFEQPPSSLTEEKGGVGGGGGGGLQQQKMGSSVGEFQGLSKPRGQEWLRVDTQKRECSESPNIPHVAENVEVITVTGPPREQEAVRQEREGGGGQRGTRAQSWERHHPKNPRLAEGPSYQRPPIAIRVSTIVSPSLNSGRPGRSRVTSSAGTSGLGVVSMEEGESRSGGVASPSTQTGRVNFSSIEELSRSDRQPDSELETEHRHHRTPQLAKIMSMLDSTRHSATFTERRSPQPNTSPTPGFMDRLSPRHGMRTTRSASPHSPRSPRTPRTPSSADSLRGKGRIGREEEGGKGEGKRQNALLQVSEAHLAILPDEDGDTPLHLAIIHENVTLTQYLVKLIVGVYMNLDIANNMRQTPLHLAIITRQSHLVQLLVQSRASVNFPDRKGNTAIHLAAARRDVKILQLLSQATSPLPDYNSKNFAGLTAVHLATREASIDVLKFLFQVGANKNAMDACSGRTALHYAVEAENFILVNFLLESGCNVNSSTFSGNTPLHIAAGRRLKEIVALLMAYGANPAIANGEGDFPTDLPASLLMQRARMNAH